MDDDNLEDEIKDVLKVIFITLEEYYEDFIDLEEGGETQ